MVFAMAYTSIGSLKKWHKNREAAHLYNEKLVLQYLKDESSHFLSLCRMQSLIMPLHPQITLVN